jgi:hypothetical protein
MSIVIQYDYVELTSKEIQDALTEYVKNKYNRTAHGKFSIATIHDREGIIEYTARSLLIKD